MALGSDYVGQDCSLARALEVVGERWSLLVLRDCFLGVRRFSDFAAHLDISRAVLTERLGSLTRAGVLRRVQVDGHPEYLLTDAGLALWPALHALAAWGGQHASGPEPYRVFTHAACGTRLDAVGRCGACDVAPGPADVVSEQGPAPRLGRDDSVTAALVEARPLLQPIRA
ncbi:winged helix-turn-helix transcriptional regulator [Solicola sp. PLA-1-18]|uniref:winged helix-turn-helix transcriptional regulator n=1 Tax=Solicola sp. PLA-1-18 TaxID=3380532 RepID=UPI003B7F4F42